MISSFTGGYKFLSNFYPCFVYDKLKGFRYKSVEHYYQANKTSIYSEREYVAEANSPGEAKKRGNSVTLLENWNDIKTEIMLYCLLSKFSDEKLRISVLNTNYNRLIEKNYWHDNYWGNCNCEKCKSIIGLNKLGKLLEFVRWVKT